MHEVTYYVLDQHRHITCFENAVEAALDLMQGLPPGWVIVDESDNPVTLPQLLH